ncbi:AAA family ATPase [Hymenobacter sp. BT662]|uniref:AAA family ATPase n=1 Tax=Hymenobacter ruricola TaxID=2791023 RepID=A0ABS0HXX3_9BACT|nr:AAA family ATPase [Hymenobacter ruricola]MBF9219484.1 AAA family ATPase [Hymenobacter ruricola]
MKNAINTLRIQNFKSIKDVTMQPRRVNLIIGQPNVGKSNILEAMSLLGGMVYDRDDKLMKQMIRYQQSNQLFYDNLLHNTVSVTTNRDNCYLCTQPWRSTSAALFMNSEAQRVFEQRVSRVPLIRIGDASEPKPLTLEEWIEEVIRRDNREQKSMPDSAEYGWLEFDSDGKVSSRNSNGFRNASMSIIPYVSVRPYLFVKGSEVGKNYSLPYLAPPHGDNLKNIIQTYRGLREEVAEMFNKYGLKLLLRMVSNELEVVKEDGGLIYSYPYSSIADTLQRIIFYLAAIESNDDAVILLEEPEAHSYPVYVSMLGRRMVESRNNQFFVATHSPYLITEILEQMLPDEGQASELAIFVAYYEDYQTKVKQLSDEEVRAIRVDELDVFYNMSRFIPRPANG